VPGPPLILDKKAVVVIAEVINGIPPGNIDLSILRNVIHKILQSRVCQAAAASVADRIKLFFTTKVTAELHLVWPALHAEYVRKVVVVDVGERRQQCRKPDGGTRWRRIRADESQFLDLSVRDFFGLRIDCSAMRSGPLIGEPQFVISDSRKRVQE